MNSYAVFCFRRDLHLSIRRQRQMCIIDSAPYGELKLNERVSSCGTEMPHSLQAIFSEKTCSVPPTTTTVTSPFASLSAVAMDCSRRLACLLYTSPSPR